MTPTDVQTESVLAYDEILHAVPGLTYRQLDHWTRRGYLTCTEQSPGSGIHRYWHAEQVPLLRRVIALTSTGIRLGLAFRLARHADPLDDLTPGVVIVFTGDLA